MKHLVAVYEERFATLIIDAEDNDDAYEQVEQLLSNVNSIQELEENEDIHYELTSKELGVALDASDPDDILPAIQAIRDDS